MVAGLAGASVLPFASGARLLGALGLSLLALTLLLLGANLAAADPLAVVRRLSAATVGAVPPAPAAAADEADLRALLRQAPLPMLFRRWHETGRSVRGTRSAQDYTTAVCLRDLLLDELHARDPAGARRWIRQGGAQPPETYIRAVGRR